MRPIPTTHNRSVGLESLLPLAGIPGVRLYSLQHGPRAADVTNSRIPALVKDFSKHLKDFADTAAVISQLDLVITVDSAVAHLAGALGKPVWVMIPAIPDFRWQTGRSDSPWYPTMRLFRQAADGDWYRTITSMTDQLRCYGRQSSLVGAGACNRHRPQHLYEAGRQAALYDDSAAPVSE